MEADTNYSEAIVRFQELFSRASESGMREPAAMSLATVDQHGGPSIRIVLLRKIDERGFVFFTNSQSRKGRQLATNPQAALCFHYDSFGEQVRVEGNTEKIDDAESDVYWTSRPRESRIGAWASQQSEILANRGELDARIKEYEEKFANQDVPRPPYWYGYRLVPRRIEFWKEGAYRLHQRTIYERGEADWNRFELYP